MAIEDIATVMEALRQTHRTSKKNEVKLLLCRLFMGNDS